jgi:hypothetical protein
MPHLQASPEGKLSTGRDRGIVECNSFGSVLSTVQCAPTSAKEDHLPIQEATKGYLGTSDPVVAMANKRDKVEKVSFDESVEGESTTNAGTVSPSAGSRISKSLVTPSPHASQSRLPRGSAENSRYSDEEVAPGSPKPSSYSEAGSPPILTIYGKVRLFHSPIRVERRVSHSEDDEVAEDASEKMNSNPPTHLRYGEASPVEEVSRPVLIRRGSSVGKRSASDDTMDNTGTDTKRGRTNEDDHNVTTAAAFEASVEEAAVAMAGMRRKSFISTSSSGEKLDPPQERGAVKPMLTYIDGFSQYYHPHHHSQASYHYPPFSHSSYGYCSSGAHPMYQVYPPQGHHHPGFYAPYPVPPPSTMQAYRPPPPYAPALNHPAKNLLETSMSCSTINTPEISTFPGIHESDKSVDESFPLNSSEWEPAGCLAPSSNRCVPLKGPVPFKAWVYVLF